MYFKGRSIAAAGTENVVISSANSTDFIKADNLRISLIYIMNKTGPGTEPCGTPPIISSKLDDCI